MVRFFEWQVAREENLQSFEIPTDIKLLTGRRDLLNATVVLTQMTTLKQRTDNLFSRFSNLTGQEKESNDVNVLENVLDIENFEAGAYGSLGKVLRSTESSKLHTHLMYLHVGSLIRWLVTCLG